MANTETEKSNSQNDNGSFDDLRILDTDSPEEAREKNDKLVEITQQSFVRTQKAEGKVFNEETKKWEKPAVAEKKTDEQVQVQPEKKPEVLEQLSSVDTIALTRADVPTEDIQIVIDYAKFKGISIQEALASSVVKAELAEKAEERTVEEAQAGGGQRRGAPKREGDALLEDARQGNLPDTDEGIAELTRARRGIKTKN